MKIALFESSDIMREVTKTASSSDNTKWDDFSYFGDASKKALIEVKYDAIITAKEFSQGSLKDIICTAQISSTNKETPIFLFTSDMSKDAVDKAFELGVTDIFFKQELPALSDTLSKIAHFPHSVKGAPVLLVEDNQAISDYYKTVLEKMNCVVYQATRCEQAQALLDSKYIELVVTDLNLEDGSQGQRIIQKMRHNERVILNKIPIMVLSSIDSLQTQTGLFFLGIDEYLVKPVLPLQFSLRAANLIKKFRIYRQAEEQALTLKSVAHFDKLTKVYNRHGFEDIAKFCVATSQRQIESVLGVMYIDLDNFKPINDKLGHETGDHVLLSIAQILKVTLRDQDVVARWGDDEFVVLLNQCDVRFVQAICKRVEDNIEAKAQSLHGVSCSIGLAFGEAKTYDDLLGFINIADKRMYEAKLAKKSLSLTGKNQA